MGSTVPRRGAHDARPLGSASGLASLRPDAGSAVLAAPPSGRTAHHAPLAGALDDSMARERESR